MAVPDAGSEELVKQFEAVLQAPAEHIHQSMLQTQFVKKVDESTGQVNIDMTFLPALHELLRETMRAEPVSAIEVMKRMLMFKRVVKLPDDYVLPYWLSLLAQHALSTAQRIRLSELPQYDPISMAGDIDLPAEKETQVAALRRDAHAFMEIAMQVYRGAGTSSAGASSGASLPPETVRMLAQTLPLNLAHTLRYEGSQDARPRRRALWESVLNADAGARGGPSALVQGMAAYALAYEACVDANEAQWQRLMGVAQSAWAKVPEAPMGSIIARQSSLGCTPECAVEMRGILNGNEMKLAPRMPPEQQNGAGGAGPSPGKGGAGTQPRGNGSNGGAKSQAPAKKPSAGSASTRKAGGAGGQGPPPAGAREDVSKLEKEMREGYELFEQRRTDEAVELFGRLLQRAYTLPRTGMSISLIFSLSHAHIEGCAQLRQWSDAEGTCAKLQELAEYADTHEIPNAIATVTDRLHMWWREKRSNLCTRRSQFPAALELLKGMEPHAARLGPRFVSAQMALLACCHAEILMRGSHLGDVQALQGAIDRGVRALRDEPVPVVAGRAPSDRPPAAVQQWMSETHFEVWLKAVPMLQSIEHEGVDVSALLRVVSPVADKFGMEIGEPMMNAKALVNSMASKQRTLGKLGDLNAMSIMFALAVLLPVLLGVWLVWRVLFLDDAADTKAQAET